MNALAWDADDERDDSAAAAGRVRAWMEKRRALGFLSPDAVAALELLADDMEVGEA